MKSNSDKNQTKLPWWVELLFVQIGLPDSWLTKFLRKKKETHIFLNDNKKNIVYCSLLIAGVLYIHPIIRYSSSSSKCINKTTEYLKSKDINSSNNQIDLNAHAVAYCNGGSLPN